MQETGRQQHGDNNNLTAADFDYCKDLLVAVVQEGIENIRKLAEGERTTYQVNRCSHQLRCCYARRELAWLERRDGADPFESLEAGAALLRIDAAAVRDALKDPVNKIRRIYRV